MDWAFFKKDLQYIFLNQIVSSIPSWTIRNFFYKCSGMKIGPKARIGINTVIISPKGITIGCRSVINQQFLIPDSIIRITSRIWFVSMRERLNLRSRLMR